MTGSGSQAESSRTHAGTETDPEAGAGSAWQRLLRWGSGFLGGPARARVVVVLAAVLGLQGADFATVSATADNLKQAFGIGNTQVGLIISAVALMTAAATLPLGVLVDRTRRTRLLAISVAIWAVTMLLSGAAQSYVWLLSSRIALGAVTAVASPTVASLTGDYFPARSRGRMWGLILAGELVGTGIGFVGSGEIAALVGWRMAFWWLAVPSLLLAWVAYRLAEPARGGQSKIELGQFEIPDERDVEGTDKESTAGEQEQRPEGAAERAARHRRVEPDPALVLHEDPTHRSLWWAVRYVLRIRTNVILIFASALGYFFFSGAQSFGLLFFTEHYGVPKSVASVLLLVVGVGAIVGVYFGGRFSDRLLSKGIINARVLVSAIAMLGVTVALAPALWTTWIVLALPLLTLGGALLGGANPALDAGRLDIMHPALWGRAEGVRTVLRGLGQAAAPLLFGWMSETLFGGGKAGLQYTFLLALGAVLIAGGLALTALRTYPRDVATASASSRGQNPDGAP